MDLVRVKQIEWQPNQGGGKSTYLGSIQVAFYKRSLSDRDAYIPAVLLPGVKHDPRDLRTEQECMYLIEGYVTAWFNQVTEK